jgi:hypothetical protein
MLLVRNTDHQSPAPFKNVTLAVDFSLLSPLRFAIGSASPNPLSAAYLLPICCLSAARTQAIHEYAAELKENAELAADGLAKGDFEPAWAFLKNHKGLVATVVLPTLLIFRFPGPVIVAMRCVLPLLNLISRRACLFVLVYPPLFLPLVALGGIKGIAAMITHGLSLSKTLPPPTSF